jgi:hypothetical protein
LTVAGLPTVAVRTPRNDAVYAFKQKVRTSFSCAEGQLGPGITDCSAFDDIGSTLTSGSFLNTSVPGAHTLTVSGTSADGQVAEQQIAYTVLPDNRFTVSHITPNASGSLTFALKLPGPGTVKLRELGGAPPVVKTVHRAGTFHFTLRAVSAPATVRLRVTFTPKGGKALTWTSRQLSLA